MPRKELVLTPREVLGKKVAKLRRKGILPANVYGRNLESVSVQLDTAEFHKTLRTMAANEVVDLKIEGERTARPAVIHRVQRDPLTSGFLHADFYQVSLREKMRADVPLVLTGTTEAVTTYGGVLLQALDTVQVEALPLDLPAHIEVDVSVLTELDSSLHVRDLPLPPDVTVLTDGDIMVARVAAPRVSEEEEAPAAAAEAGAPAAEGEAAGEGETETAAEGESSAS